MTEALAQTVLQIGMTNYVTLRYSHYAVTHFMLRTFPLRTLYRRSLRSSVTQILLCVLYVGRYACSIGPTWRRFRPMW